MSEVVAGVIPQVLMNNTLMLTIYFFISISLGIFLKEKPNKLNEFFTKQFKESGLAEE